MPQSPLYYGLLVALAIALLFAASTDIRRREIDNWLNAGIALAAPAFWWAGGLALWPDIGVQVALALGALVVAVGLFAMGQMGGGDVKLIAALALWFPPDTFLRMLVVMAVLGYALTMGLGAWHVGRAERGARSRDTIVLVALSLIACTLIATLAGVLDVPMPEPFRAMSRQSMWIALVVMQLPVVVLAIVSLKAIAIFRRRKVSMETPYGVAIAGAALWLIGLQIAAAPGVQLPLA